MRHRILAKRLVAEDDSRILTPSQFVESAVNIAVAGATIPFSFVGRRYLRKVYDTPSRRVLLYCARQVGKSTTLGNKMLASSVTRKNFRVIYAAPRDHQSAVFSNDKLRTPIQKSPLIKAHQIIRGATDSTMFKEFTTGSTIRLFHAYVSPDSIRGNPGDEVDIDELQDIDITFLPIILECLFTSPFKSVNYAGTPKTHTNTAAVEWSKSTQNEWLIPCEHCGSSATFRTWNVVGMDNIGKTGLICRKCGGSLDPQHPDADWVAMNKNPDDPLQFEGFRIPQPIAPDIDWADLLNKLKHYPLRSFMNEVIATAYDVGTKPITESEIRDICNPNISMTATKRVPFNLAWLEQHSLSSPVWMGLDWGTAENSYTLITLWTYISDKLSMVYAHRLVGEDAVPKARDAKVDEYIRKFNVQIVGSDYGGGFDGNDAIERTFGFLKLVKFQYANVKEPIAFNPSFGRFMLNRSEMISKVLIAIKNKLIAFPCWEEFEDGGFASDFLALTADWNQARDVIVYGKDDKTATDDTVHSSLYGILASMLLRPRPDILEGGYAYLDMIRKSKK